MRKKIETYFSFFNNSKFLITFDIARSTALLLILCMHIESGFNSYTGNNFQNFVGIGSYGVPIFFFISGFLIFKSLNVTPVVHFSHFWRKRITRIVPLYYSMLIIYILCIIIFSKILNNFQEINLLKVLTSFFFGFGKMDLTYLSAAWSLWYEFVFYSFASLLLINKNIFVYKRLEIIVFCIFILSLFLYANGSIYFYFSSGSFLFLIFKLKRFSYLAFHLITLFILSIFSNKDDLNSLIIYFIFIFISFSEKLLINLNIDLRNIINLFSKISYSAYLTQIFTIPIFYKIQYRIWQYDLVYWNSLLSCLLFTIIISFFVWSNLEKPLNKFFKII